MELILAFVTGAATVYLFWVKPLLRKIREGKMTKTVEAWCCGIAADHEIGETNVEIYATAEDCLAARACAREEPEDCAPRKLTITFETGWVKVD